MSKHRYKSTLEVLANPDPRSVLPTDRPVAIYYRQSTLEQVGNISTSMQTIDMVAYLVQRGWAENKISLIDMDAGVSGTKKIDERPGMRHLFDLITQGQVGAVACQDEDRLFRDFTQIQVNVFIDACRVANVLVLTPSMVYDFSNEFVGTFHARQFRFKSEMAADYINTVIKGKLHRAKQRMRMEGRWEGSGIAPGFMVDMRKMLPDGSTNQNWRRFVPFEPYAQVVNQYFQLFLSYAGNLRATLRHIYEHGPFYPDPQLCPPPDGYKVVHQIHRYASGYCPKMNSLAELLTNVIYIGHWHVKGTIVRWNNHPAIVSEDVFMRAYNYLMDTAFDGLPNPEYKPFRQHARPTLEEHRPVPRPLCSGMIVALLDGKWRKVGTNWIGHLEKYNYILWSNDQINAYVWGKEAGIVDEAVAAQVREKLEITFNADAWQKSLSSLSETYEIERKSKAAQLASLERVLTNLITSLDTLSDPEMIEAVQQKYEAGKLERQRLQTDIASLSSETNRLNILSNLKEKYASVLMEWETITQDEKRVILHTFIRRIEAEHHKRKGLRLLVYWLDESIDELTISRRSPSGDTWLPTDAKRLLTLIESGASQLEFCKAFPMRTWHMIRMKLQRLGFKQAAVLPKGGNAIRNHETYKNYILRIKDSENVSAKCGEQWTSQEEHLLYNLLDANANELEIAAAFPRRTWGNIRKKINGSYTGDFHIHRSKHIRSDETFVMYYVRVNNTTGYVDILDDEVRPESISSIDRSSAPYSPSSDLTPSKARHNQTDQAG